MNKRNLCKKLFLPLKVQMLMVNLPLENKKINNYVDIILPFFDTLPSARTVFTLSVDKN